MHTAGARNVIILIDGTEAGEVDAATANAYGGTPGYGWHKTINTQLTTGEHLITIMKSETTAAAAIVDAIELSNNPDFVPAGPINHSTRDCKTTTPTNTPTFTLYPTLTSSVTSITPYPSNTVCPECSRCTCASCTGYINSANMNEGSDIKPGSIGLSVIKSINGNVLAIVPKIWLSDRERVIDSYIERDGVLFSRPPTIITSPGTYKNLKLIVKTENANYASGGENEIIISENKGCQICPPCVCPTCPYTPLEIQTYISKAIYTFEPRVPVQSIVPTWTFETFDPIWPVQTFAPYPLSSYSKWK